MATANFIATSLPAYVQENHDMLVKDVVFGADSIKYFSVQSGIKKDAYINVMDIRPTLQDGAACGFTPAGDVEITQREIETGAIKVNLDICPENLLGKYAEYTLSISAQGEPLPFEAYIVKGLIAQIAKKVETLVWCGDTTSASSDLKWFNGITTIARNDANTVKVALGAVTGAYNKILAVYNAIPEGVLLDGAKIFVSPAVFREFKQELVAKNLYHYDPQNKEENEFLFPGSDVAVVRTQGLAGKVSIVAAASKDIVYGCDIESAKEEVKVWFSEDADVYKVKVRFNAGVNYAFSDRIVIGE